MIKNKTYIRNFIVLLIFYTCILLVSCGKENYTEKAYSYTFDDEIKYIDLEWNIGDIEISSGDKFSIEEVSINDKCITPLKYSINNQKLIVNYNDSKKKLKITLDKNKKYDDFSINSIVSNITLNEINLKKFTAKTKKGVTNITSSSIDYVDIEITCQNDWACVEIKNNIFNTFEFKMEKVHIFIYENNKSNSCEIKIVSSDIHYSKNICKYTSVISNNATIKLNLNANLGYEIEALTKNTYIDFETLSYNNKYMYGNCENIICCKAINGTLEIKRSK